MSKLPDNTPYLIPIDKVIESITSVIIHSERYIRTEYTDYGHELIKAGFIIDPGYTNDDDEECCLIDID